MIACSSWEDLGLLHFSQAAPSKVMGKEMSQDLKLSLSKSQSSVLPVP